MAVSIRQVAERAGVSLGTVSKVLNNSDNAQIAVETRQRVQSAALELDYRPNPLARSLGRQKTDTVGLMLSDLRNPFFQDVLECAEKMVLDAGYQILLDVKASDYSQYHELRKISGWLVDGVLMWATPDVDLAKYLGERAKDVPVVYLGHLREDGTDAVALDLYDAGKRATEHLLERGRKRLCLISTYPPEDFLWPSHSRPGFANNQLPAIQHVCRQAGIEPEVIVIDNQKMPVSSFQAGMELAARPAATRPDAIICHNDHIALYICNALIRSGVRVPEDVAVIGFDGLEEGRCLPCGPLTSFRVPVETLCRTALGTLLRRIEGDRDMPKQQVLVPMELVPGGTT